MDRLWSSLARHRIYKCTKIPTHSKTTVRQGKPKLEPFGANEFGILTEKGLQAYPITQSALLNLKCWLNSELLCQFVRNEGARFGNHELLKKLRVDRHL
jgi:hypothetical protein